ncbi:Hypothetical predicted protein [Podarcis lilfordi]|uniref:Uncharacterized protein n=1 Tax=Podarcis lilfordi TaxID=74358 RepID=A0AA35K9L4_9SAUR|nr:Hypothetical predicted protein [Podarcis lilfordi]
MPFLSCPKPALKLSFTAWANGPRLSTFPAKCVAASDFDSHSGRIICFQHQPPLNLAWNSISLRSPAESISSCIHFTLLTSSYNSTPPSLFAVSTSILQQ